MEDSADFNYKEFIFNWKTKLEIEYNCNYKLEYNNNYMGEKGRVVEK